MSLILTGLSMFRSASRKLFAASSAFYGKMQLFGEARRNRQEIRALAELDEHLLVDIGLSRADIAGALSVRFDEDPSMALRRGDRVRHIDRARLRRDAQARHPTCGMPEGFAEGMS